MKAFIPIGRPFLDYILSALADAGLTRLCIVIGPEHDVVRRYYASEVTLTRHQRRLRRAGEAARHRRRRARGRGLDRRRAVPGGQRRQLLSRCERCRRWRRCAAGPGRVQPRGAARRRPDRPRTHPALRAARSRRPRACAASSRSRTGGRRAIQPRLLREHELLALRRADLRRVPKRAAVAARRARVAAGGATGDRRRPFSVEAVLSDAGVLDLSGRADIAAVARGWPGSTSACDRRRARAPVAVAQPVVDDAAQERADRAVAAGRPRRASRLFVPGRIEVLGKHTDYAGGRSLTCAAERGFRLRILRETTAAPRRGRAGWASRRVRVDPGLRPPVGHWTNYPMTVARRLARNFGAARARRRRRVLRARCRGRPGSARRARSSPRSSWCWPTSTTCARGRPSRRDSR